MKRRRFLTLVGLGVLVSIGLIMSNIFSKKGLKRFAKSILNSFKPSAEFPPEGVNVPVETALNSRCTSDYDSNPENFHWGMFDGKKKLTSEQIEEVISRSRIPRFTEYPVRIHIENSTLTFLVANRVSGIAGEWVMVESGMQQQAVGLVCASMGVGMVFRNLGRDGAPISDAEYGTIKIRLGPMKPAYGGEFWTRLAPTGAAPWLKGNLPDPDRAGEKSLISTLSGLKIKSDGSSRATDHSISQLLWAARGRTPHLYKSLPWGMTIPTWAGIQGISNVYLVSDNELLEYKNWHDGRPTHALKPVKKIERQSYGKLMNLFMANRLLIVIGKNEAFARALWEVGYQLLNLLLQAHSLDVSYHALLLDETQKAAISPTGIKDPVAVLAL